jgi:hypothetical protein
MSSERQAARRSREFRFGSDSVARRQARARELDVSAIGAGSGAFFDELIRTNRDKQMTNPGRAASFRSSYVAPAVEYLQGQRARSLMMMELAEATADAHVYSCR